MRIRIEKWNYAGEVCRSIADKMEDLGVLVLRGSGSTFRARAGDIIVNYGTSEKRNCLPGVTVLNHPDKVAAKYNKLDQYRLLEAAGVPVVKFTTEQRVVRDWLRDEYDVYARMASNSSGGHGIVVIKAAREAIIPSAPVYTRRFRARREYRVHVFNGQSIDVSQKRKQEGARANAIRSFGNGYVFCHNDVEAYPQAMVDASIAAVRALGLDFGAVDVLLMDNGNVAVLEVNSAPGMEGTTLDRWTEALRQYILARAA